MNKVFISDSQTFVIVIIIVFVAILLGSILVPVLYSVYAKKQLPTKKIVVDVTGKRIKDANDGLDYYLINYGKGTILAHIDLVSKKKEELIAKANGDKKKITRLENRWKTREAGLFIFEFVRIKTRYKQVNYQKKSYKVQELEIKVKTSPNVLLSRIDFLEQTGHTITFNQFNSIDQRNAMTKELREFVKKRDNYTCQICGKYMPDEVGLHIDHIIPVSKGGKSIPQNLRVLCSKCNGKKGAK